ncbi:MAG: hypothetical protein JNJ41_12270 [Bacteroidia bacterium]|nr:hypothetical protein [Bacteroidia bacterium]
MKKIVVIFFVSVIINLNAQIQVKINDKPVVENQTIEAKDIKKMDISFSNPQKLQPNTDGKARLYVELLGLDNKVVEGYTVEKEGVNAINSFLTMSKSYILYEEGGENKTFGFTYLAPPTLKAMLEQVGTKETNKVIKVKVYLTFRDKMVDKYQNVTYGDYFDLLPVFTFKINNQSVDGTIQLLGTDIKLSAEKLKPLNYVKQEVDENYFLTKERNPLLTNSKVVRCSFKSQKHAHHTAVFVNVMDLDSKTQDAVINELKTQFETVLVNVSNFCNSDVAKLAKEKIDHWNKIMDYNEPKFIVTSLDKKYNKEFDREKIMEPMEIGLFKGYKFSQMVTTRSCDNSAINTAGHETLSPEIAKILQAAAKSEADSKKVERVPYGTVSVYFMKHPKNSKKVIMLFSHDDNHKETMETAKEFKTFIDSFIGCFNF